MCYELDLPIKIFSLTLQSSEKKTSQFSSTNVLHMFFSKCPFPILKITQSNSRDPSYSSSLSFIALWCFRVLVWVFRHTLFGGSWGQFTSVGVLHYMLSHTKWQLSINYRHSFPPFLWYIFIPACKTHLSKDCFYSSTSLEYNLKTVLPLCLGGVWLSTLLNK